MNSLDPIIAVCFRSQNTRLLSQRCELPKSAREYKQLMIEALKSEDSEANSDKEVTVNDLGDFMSTC